MARITKDPEVRRNELMDLAEQLFIEKGYEHTSASDIIRKAGVAQGTFYYYFKSKDDILGAIIDRYFERFSGQIRRLAEAGEVDACEKLRLIGEAQAEMDAGKMRLNKYSSLEMSLARHEKYDEYLAAEIVPLMARIIEQGVREGSFEVDYPLETAELIIMLAQHTHDCTRSATTAEEQARKLKVTTALMEKALGVKVGTLFS